MSAPWPQPPRDGVTIWHVSDTHFSEKFPRMWAFAPEMARDLNAPFIQNVHARIHTGDIISGYYDANHQDAEARAWLEEALGGPQDVWVVGNHDLIGDLGASGPDRSVDEWEQIYGRPGNTSTLVDGHDGAQVRLLAMAPSPSGHDFGDGNTWSMSQETISWLDAELTADPNTPAFLACHYMLEEQADYYDAGTKAQPEGDFANLVSDHPNVLGWLSGHAHWGVENPNAVKTVAFGNRSAFPLICAPSAQFTPGGIYQRNDSYVITVRDPSRIEVRCRRHNSFEWISDRFGNQVQVLSPA